MPLSRMSTRTTTIVLLCVLLLEAVLVVSLRGLGWYGTGNAIQLLACIFVALLPLLVASAMLLRNRLRFGLRALLIATTLVAVFLMVSLLPMVKHRAARQASMRLLSANATLHEGSDCDEFYSQIDLEPPPTISSVETGDVPPWLTSFANHTSIIPKRYRSTFQP